MEKLVMRAFLLEGSLQIDVVTGIQVKHSVSRFMNGQAGKESHGEVAKRIFRIFK
jgi:hypothetical protein